MARALSPQIAVSFAARSVPGSAGAIPIERGAGHGVVVGTKCEYAMLKLVSYFVVERNMRTEHCQRRREGVQFQLSMSRFVY